MSYFVNEFSRMQKEVHELAVEKGWWDEPRNDGEMIALIHSEVSEALEALRSGDIMDTKVAPSLKDGLQNVEIELADIVIRVMDFAQGRGYGVARAIEAKMKYNRGREKKHGKLF